VAGAHMHTKNPESRRKMAVWRTKHLRYDRASDKPAGSDELGEAQAQRAGINFEWHSGASRVWRLRDCQQQDVTILWEEGASATNKGDHGRAMEILKLAFVGSGRIAILSDQEDKRWMYDYRFLEALRG